jgi:hypothetical protein
VRQSRSSEVSPYPQPYPRRTHGRALPEHPDTRLLGRRLALGADSERPTVFARVEHKPAIEVGALGIEWTAAAVAGNRFRRQDASLLLSQCSSVALLPQPGGFEGVQRSQ